MPKGGSDCWGNCWVNRRDGGRKGYNRDPAPGPAYCEIRGLPIERPFYTYCANHPHRSPARYVIPIGPVFKDTERKIAHLSDDTEPIRAHLLELLAAIEETPASEYPIGSYRDETVVWQLGEFREPRAVPGLERIASFDRHATGGVFQRTRGPLVELARAALAQVHARPPTESPHPEDKSITRTS